MNKYLRAVTSVLFLIIGLCLIVAGVFIDCEKARAANGFAAALMAFACALKP